MDYMALLLKWKRTNGVEEVLEAMKYRSIESMPLVITVADIADTLAIGRCKAYSLVNSGKIKSLKIGCTYRIPREVFVDYLNSQNEAEVK